MRYCYHSALTSSVDVVTRSEYSWKNDSYDNKRTDDRYTDSDSPSIRQLAREYESWGENATTSKNTAVYPEFVEQCAESENARQP